MYELATGKPPFASTSFQDIVEKAVNESAPRLPTYSNDFNDIIAQLLIKHPAKRITWDGLISHPFFAAEHPINKCEIPQQPHFDAWLNAARGATSTTNSVSSTKNGESTSTPQQVNLLRLSLNVQKSLKKDLEEQYQQHPSIDVQLNNRNQLVNLAGRDDEEDGGADDDDETDEQQQQNQQQIVMDSQFHSSRSQHPSVPPSQQSETPIHNARSQKNQQPLPPQQKPPTSSTTSLVPVNELFTHPSDNTVKPIIGNREIEKAQQDTFRRDQLPFECFSADEV